MKNLVLTTAFVLIAATSPCLEKIGEVVAVEGLLKAVDIDQNERILMQKGDVYLGDILVTDEAAKGQVQFTDGTLLLLIPGSRYSVNSYSTSTNHYVAKLYHGGVRLLTGLIAKKEPENFELSTPNATIGVRGTIFETRMDSENLFVGSSSGTLSVNNAGGSLAISSDLPPSYASVSSMGSAPEALTARPPALDLSLFTVPAGGLAFDHAPVQATQGNGAAASSAASFDNFSWGPLLGTLTVIGAVAGIVVTSANQKTVKTAQFAH